MFDQMYKQVVSLKRESRFQHGRCNPDATALHFKSSPEDSMVAQPSLWFYNSKYSSTESPQLCKSAIHTLWKQIVPTMYAEVTEKIWKTGFSEGIPLLQDNNWQTLSRSAIMKLSFRAPPSKNMFGFRFILFFRKKECYFPL